MPYLFTSESVSEGHPDKIADQVSDAILDAYLAQDPESKVACETLVTTDYLMISGEVKSTATVDAEKIARDVIRRIGYTKPEYLFDCDSCKIEVKLEEQSPDINQGIERKNNEDQGAGDQGMMFGYATKESENLMPLTLDLSHMLLRELAAIRKTGEQMTYLRPDSKSQVTIKYGEDHKPLSIHTIVLSTQHDEFIEPKDDSEESKLDAEKQMIDQITDDIRNILIPRVKSNLPSSTQQLFDNNFKLWVNPTGRFVIGGPHGDTGLTGRKIIVDTYGGKVAHGGGAFSGKDPSKVDRSAAYASRHIAKNLVAAGIADELMVQVSYAIGVAEPINIYMNTYGTAKAMNDNGNILSDSEIAKKASEVFDMRPQAIINRLKLKAPIYSDSAAYGHFGRASSIERVSIYTNGETVEMEVELFTWEKLDLVDQLIEHFNIKENQLSG
ncbi:MAG: methionine adenosyltransferase [Bacteroidetes bacterium]|nr:methionine adenosyltransferase [Bacteroidota bacterium]